MNFAREFTVLDAFLRDRRSRLNVKRRDAYNYRVVISNVRCNEIAVERGD